MNRIITIGREFGSGGREIGKKLADKLGYAYYDKTITHEICNRSNLSPEYVQQVVEKKPIPFFSINSGNTLHTFMPDYALQQQNSVYSFQMSVIKEFAEKSDCVIVGRCADYILKDYKPFKLFIYADMESKLSRCKTYAPQEENLDDKQLIKSINDINKQRAKYYEYYTGNKWGSIHNYDLCINTSFMDIDRLVNALVSLCKL